LHRGWASGTSKGSAIRYVEGKTALWATYYMLLVRTHVTSLSLNQPLSEILKTFLEALKLLV
jgi:hypothetical protein